MIPNLKRLSSKNECAIQHGSCRNVSRQYSRSTTAEPGLTRRCSSRKTAPPLNLLVLGRDHKLYYEAYNDYTDLNNDGVIDIGYKPSQITYFGYFDSYKCYTYDGKQVRPRECHHQQTMQWAMEWRLAQLRHDRAYRRLTQSPLWWETLHG